MTITFRPAVRENVGLLIGLAGASGSGKTYTAMRLASGIAAGKPFAVIDTERGRAKHYADQFTFHHADLEPPFTPERYEQMIAAADKAGYPVIVVDSMSHEWYGEGGVLDMQDAEHKKSGYSEGARMASWIRPKMAHKSMVQSILRSRAHLILCFRAEPKIEMTRDEKGKTVVVPKESLIGFKGWIPVTEKNMPFELTVSIMLTPDEPGKPHWIKMQKQHQELFPRDVEVNEESGRRIAEWAAGGSTPTPRVEPAAASDQRFEASLKRLREAALVSEADFKTAWGAIGPLAQRALEAEKNRIKEQRPWEKRP